MEKADYQLLVCPNCATTNRILAGQKPGEARCGRCKSRLFVGRPAPANAEKFMAHISRNDIPVVVDFWAEWCGPCKAMAPAFEKAAAEFEPEVRFLKVDTDAESELSARYNIRSIPTLMMFRNGRIIAQQAGAVDSRTLAAWVRHHMTA